jgi:hypothetical protein
MARNLWFTYVDGREIVAATPREALESLRAGDTTASEDLEQFLELLWVRGETTFANRLDVGVPGEDIDVRCRKALMSLIQHGWLRVLKPEAVWPPAGRRAGGVSAAFA